MSKEIKKNQQQTKNKQSKNLLAGNTNRNTPNTAKKLGGANNLTAKKTKSKSSAGSKA